MESAIPSALLDDLLGGLAGLSCSSLQQKATDENQQREKGQSLGETRCELPGVPPSRVAWGHTVLPATMWGSACDVSQPGKRP